LITSKLLLVFIIIQMERTSIGTRTTCTSRGGGGDGSHHLDGDEGHVCRKKMDDGGNGVRVREIDHVVANFCKTASLSSFILRVINNIRKQKRTLSY